MKHSTGQHYTYRHANETLSHVDQIVLLYCHAISYVQQAQEAIKTNDFEGRYRLIENTCLIINSLRAGLDFDVNEEVASALDDHYNSIEALLVSVQGDNSLETCDQIVENLKIIRNSWEKIAEKTAILAELKAADNSNDEWDNGGEIIV